MISKIKELFKSKPKVEYELISPKYVFDHKIELESGDVIEIKQAEWHDNDDWVFLSSEKEERRLAINKDKVVKAEATNFSVNDNEELDEKIKEMIKNEN